MDNEIKNAVIYARFSSHNQTEQSIEGQVRVCREYCERNNINLVSIYADRATSASKDIEKRVEFLRMIKDAEKGTFDTVLVYKLDRFARSRYDSATYKYKLKKCGVSLVSVTEGISNSPEGVILESVLEGMAEYYSLELSQKIKRGQRESAYKNHVMGGVPPLGYKLVDKQYAIDERTAPIAQEAFKLYAGGTNVAEICRHFNAKGYRTSKGARFGKSSFTKMFRNERYIGTYIYQDQKFENAIPALIDMDTWNQVQARISKTKSAPARNKAKRIYLLSGKLYCGHCNHHMTGDHAYEYMYYRCTGKKNLVVDCHKKNVNAKWLEKIVIEDALSLLTDDYIEKLAETAVKKNNELMALESSLPTVQQRLTEVKKSLDNLTRALELGGNAETLVMRMKELEAERRTLVQKAKEESEKTFVLEKEHVIYWLSQFKNGSIDDPEFCRILVDMLIQSVVVRDDNDDPKSKDITIQIKYNLSSNKSKTYHLKSGDTLWDFESLPPSWSANPNIEGMTLTRVIKATH